MDDEVVDRLLLATSHFALARTEAELQQQWVKLQSDFQAAWPRRGRKVIFLIHDQYDRISDDDVVEVLGQINDISKSKPVDVILHTRGGSASATDQIAATLVARPRTAAFVPIFANSGGTEIALSTQTIYMGRGAELGPFDLLFNGRPARDLIRLAEELGDKAPPGLRLDAIEATRALKEEARKVCKVINRTHKGFLGWRGCELANKLTSGDFPHSFGISFKQARKLHMNVRKSVPKSVYVLLNARMEQLARLRELQRSKIEQNADAAA